MTTPLRTRLDELEVYVTRVAEATGIPPAHLEKDFWVTEVLRGASNASEATGCSVIFKGGTSLSKAHRIIQRFSEAVDLVVVLPESGKGAKDSTLKTFVAAAESTTGIEGTVDPSSATKGMKRTAAFAYPTTHRSALKPGVLMELGTRGGALPYRRLPIHSLIAERAEAVDLPIDFEEAAPVSLLVLEPVRTLVEKLILLHHAATEGDAQRRATTARHYYDVDRLLCDDGVLPDLRSTCSPEKSPSTHAPRNCRPRCDHVRASLRARPVTLPRPIALKPHTAPPWMSCCARRTALILHGVLPPSARTRRAAVVHRHHRPCAARPPLEPALPP